MSMSTGNAEDLLDAEAHAALVTVGKVDAPRHDAQGGLEVGRADDAHPAGDAWVGGRATRRPSMAEALKVTSTARLTPYSRSR